MAKTLGQVLRAARTLKGLSLARAAGPAKISPAYLDKLEQDRVREPSPHILYSLASVLKVKYEDLMRLAGYVVSSERDRDSGSSVLAQAFASKDLTDEEIEELATYLGWYRSQRKGR